jgi:YgiT-type zinc finger domain-containing protein
MKISQKGRDNERDSAMEFWAGERCEYCNGAIKEKMTDLSRKVKGKYVVIEHVPTGVCSECGTRYYSANVLKKIEETISGRRKAKRELQVPVYSF